jgi:hypothetical protein
MIIVEYELTATLTSTGQRSSAAFIGVLKVRDGKTVLWREYQNVLAMSLALSTLPRWCRRTKRLRTRPPPQADPAGLARSAGAVINDRCCCDGW